jgi:hypothetical protein
MPFYDDEVEAAAVEASNEDERQREAAAAVRAARVAAMLTGGKKAGDKAAAGAAAKFAKPVDPDVLVWRLPGALVALLDAEREDLLGVVDTFERHLPKHHEPAPPPPPDRVRDFFGAGGVSGLRLAALPVKNAVAALSGEGGEGPAFTRGVPGFRNTVAEEQWRERLLGSSRKSSRKIPVPSTQFFEHLNKTVATASKQSNPRILPPPHTHPTACTHCPAG